MLKVYDNDHIIAKFGRWFEILLVIGCYTIGSVGAIVCHCVWVIIVEIDHSVGVINNTYVIVVGCCDHYYEPCCY